MANFSSSGKAADSASVCRLCLRQAARSSGDNEFGEARLFTFTLHHVAAFRNRALARARDRLFRGEFRSRSAAGEE